VEQRSAALAGITAVWRVLVPLPLPLPLLGSG